MVKKFLLKIHRMLGSLLSLAFVVWFLSGFFMIFSGFPHAPKEELFNRQPSFSSADSIVCLSDTNFCGSPKIVLEKVNNKPIYRVHCSRKNEKVLDGTSSLCIDSFPADELESIIQWVYNAPVKNRKVINDFDQWIPWSHFKKYFPIHKYYLEDPEHTIVYLSAKTGTIVQETTRKKRWLARFGAIPHWYYFKSLRLKRDLWIKIIVWISGLGSIMSISGIILGVYRFQKARKRKKNGIFAFSPYKKKWYKWHHVSGFIFGFFVFTFVFSGMMSLQEVPKAIIPVKGKVNYAEIWNEKQFGLNDFKLPVDSLFNNNQFSGIKRIEWCMSGKKPYYFIYQSDLYKPVIVYAGNSEKPMVLKFTQQNLEEKLRWKLPGINFDINLITSPDGYYNKRKNKTWPVYKVVMEDLDKTWLYIDPDNLEIVKTLNKNTRVRRWLYKGLHSFDFKFLTKNDWLRKLLLIFLSIFGTVASISGLVLSYKYVRRKIKKLTK